MPTTTISPKLAAEYEAAHKFGLVNEKNAEHFAAAMTGIIALLSKQGRDLIYSTRWQTQPLCSCNAAHIHLSGG